MIDHKIFTPQQSKRFNVSLPEDLVRAVDRQAKAYYTTRSGLIRDALMEYLLSKKDQPEDDELFTDPEVVLRILQQQKSHEYLKKLLRERKYRQSNRNRKQYPTS